VGGGSNDKATGLSRLKLRERSKSWEKHSRSWWKGSVLIMRKSEVFLVEETSNGFRPSTEKF
jgi:hypothetical protein